MNELTKIELWVLHCALEAQAERTSDPEHIETLEMLAGKVRSMMSRNDGATE